MTELLNEEQLDAKLEESPAPRVTKEFIEEQISYTVYQLAFKTVTICNIALKNGFSVRGESACVNPENYNEQIGKTIAYKNAFDKLWAFYGFMLAEDQFRKTGVPA